MCLLFPNGAHVPLLGRLQPTSRYHALVGGCFALYLSCLFLLQLPKCKLAFLWRQFDVGLPSDGRSQVALRSADLVNVDTGIHRKIDQISNIHSPSTASLLLGVVIDIVLRIAGGLCQGKYVLAASGRVKKKLVTYTDSGLLFLPKPNVVCVVAAVERVPSNGSLAATDQLQPGAHCFPFLYAADRPQQPRRPGESGVTETLNVPTFCCGARTSTTASSD